MVHSSRTRRVKRRVLRWAAVGLGAGLFASACGGAEESLGRSGDADVAAGRGGAAGGASGSGVGPGGTSSGGLGGTLGGAGGRGGVSAAGAGATSHDASSDTGSADGFAGAAGQDASLDGAGGADAADAALEADTAGLDALPEPAGIDALPDGSDAMSDADSAPPDPCGASSLADAGPRCVSDAECGDGLFCNGRELCVAGRCVAGSKPCQDDGCFCTVDSCDESKRSFEPGIACSRIVHHEYCMLEATCLLGYCCLHVEACTSDTLCDDGLACNGAEVCDRSTVPSIGCKTVPPPGCDDGVACTFDHLCGDGGACQHFPQDSKCPCGQTCDPVLGCGVHCQPTECQGRVYECGNCLDDDGDGVADMADPDCLGPCDIDESKLGTIVPGALKAPCWQDCYFDRDYGNGNDQCTWSHRCDPLEATCAAPERSCVYDPDASVPATSASCTELFAAQAPTCDAFCGPLVPNGCDCFGCCQIPGASTPVWIGAQDTQLQLTCTVADAADPRKCPPCTIVPSCFNPCDHCELCVGKAVLPADCAGVVSCAPGAKACGSGCAPGCPPGQFCNTGCCAPAPS